MSREAMQMALEFLSHDMVAEDWPHQKRKDAVCDALRAALAKPQTTHWEGCEAVHPECRKPEQNPFNDDAERYARKLREEREVKNLADYEVKTYKIGGFHLDAGFYSAAELREMVKEFDAMDAAAIRSRK